MKLFTALTASLAGVIAIGAVSTSVLADLPDPKPIQFVAAAEIDFEGELKDAIYAVGYEGDYQLSSVDLALALGKTLSEIGEVGVNSQVATTLCAIHAGGVESRRQDVYDYYRTLTNVNTLATEGQISQHAEAIKNAIEATVDEDPKAFEVYGLAVAAATQECQG